MTDYGYFQFYARVVSLLLAGDIQARVVSNDQATSVAVEMVDKSMILWSGQEDGCWGYSLINSQGEVVRSEMTPLLYAPYFENHAEEVARHIAMFDYPAPVPWP